MTRTLPPAHIVRYDYHRRPRSTTAVIISQRTRNVVAVGVAKFNPKDGEADRSLGERIALGRALATLAEPQRHRERVSSVRVALPAEAYPHKALAHYDPLADSRGR